MRKNGRWHDKSIWSQFLSMKQKRGIDLVNQTLASVQLHRLTSKATDAFEQVLLKIVLNNLCASLGFEWFT